MYFFSLSFSSPRCDDILRQKVESVRVHSATFSVVPVAFFFHFSSLLLYYFSSTVGCIFYSSVLSTLHNRHFAQWEVDEEKVVESWIAHMDTDRDVRELGAVKK